MLSILLSRKTNKIKSNFGTFTHWCYFGKDIKKRRDIKNIYRLLNEYEYSANLDEVTSSFKKEFLDAISELGQFQKDKLAWWSSSLSYKCPLSSDLFLLICYSIQFDLIVAHHQKYDHSPILIFIEDRWLYQFLKIKYIKNKALNFRSNVDLSRDRIYLILRGLFARIYFLAYFSFLTLYSKRSRNIDTNLDLENKDDLLIFTYSWVVNSLARKEKYIDPYLGRVIEIINKKLGSMVIPIVSLDGTKKAINILCKNSQTLLIASNITIINMIRSILKKLLLTIPTGASLYKYKVLLEREMFFEFSSLTIPTGFLEYSCLKKEFSRLKKNKKIFIIYPFENQPREKILLMAAKENHQNIILIGYQHTSIPVFLLNYFLGKNELDILPLPDRIVANSKINLEILKNAGYKENMLANGGSVRFEHIVKDREKSRKIMRKYSDGSFFILVVLPYDIYLAKELLLAIFDQIDIFKDMKIKFIIKIHPQVPDKEIIGVLPFWPHNFIQDDKPISAILDEVNLVIYSSTTVAMEAMERKTPIVKYFSKYSIDLDPLMGIKEITYLTCGENNIKETLLDYMNNFKDEIKKEPEKKMRTNFFEPINEATWINLIESYL